MVAASAPAHVSVGCAGSEHALLAAAEAVFAEMGLQARVGSRPSAHRRRRAAPCVAAPLACQGGAASRAVLRGACASRCSPTSAPALTVRPNPGRDPRLGTFFLALRRGFPGPLPSARGADPGRPRCNRISTCPHKSPRAGVGPPRDAPSCRCCSPSAASGPHRCASTSAPADIALLFSGCAPDTTALSRARLRSQARAPAALPHDHPRRVAPAERDRAPGTPLDFPQLDRVKNPRRAR
jgi:hypothetical protein